jgi:hypothetical protein
MGRTHFCRAPWYPVRGYSGSSYESRAISGRLVAAVALSEKIRPLACHDGAPIAEWSVIGMLSPDLDAVIVAVAPNDTTLAKALPRHQIPQVTFRQKPCAPFTEDEYRSIISSLPCSTR